MLRDCESWAFSPNSSDYTTYGRFIQIVANNVSIVAGAQNGDPAFSCGGSAAQLLTRRATPGGPFSTLTFSARLAPNYTAPGSNGAVNFNAVDLVNGVNHVSVNFNPYSQAISVSNSTGTIFTTGAAQFQPNSSFWAEVKFVIGSGTSGSVVVRINGVTVVNLTGINTQNGSRAVMDTTSVSTGPTGGGIGFAIQDMCWSDAAGTYNNGFLGDRRVYGTVATVNGDTNNFTPVGHASNYQNAGSVPPGGDTYYNYSATVGNIDLYKGNYPANVTGIAGVMASAITRKDDSGARNFATIIKSGGTVGTGASVPMAGSYTVQSDVYETDPSTSVPFIAAALPNLQFGGKVSA